MGYDNKLMGKTKGGLQERSWASSRGFVLPCADACLPKKFPSLPKKVPDLQVLHRNLEVLVTFMSKMRGVVGQMAQYFAENLCNSLFRRIFAPEAVRPDIADT